jgi:O-antigen ligase
VQRITYGLNSLSHHVLIGVGMLLEPERVPHDSYFFVLVQSGVVGFVLLWGPLCYIFLNLVRMSRMPSDAAEKAVFLALAGSMLAHLLIGTVVYILHWRHFWLLVGLSVAALRTFGRRSSDGWELSK